MTVVAEVEPVVCCVCHVPGRPVWDVSPFGVVRCPNCDLVFVSPRLTAAARERLYDDTSYFEGDGSVYGSAGRMTPAMALQRLWTSGRLDLAERETRRTPGEGRLLEAGCAYGLFLDAARDRGWTVTGVEVSAPAAAHARDRLGLDVRTGELGDVDDDGAPFDVVCAWDTIEHVPDPVAFWRSVRARLTPGGVALFSTPYVDALAARALGTRWWTLKPAEHIWHFTPATHRRVAEAAGMRLDRVIRSPLARVNAGRIDSLVGVARRPLG